MIFRESLTYIAARAVPALFSLGTVALFTRLLAPAEYGRYALIVSAAGTLNILFFSWVLQSTLRFYHDAEEDGDERLSTPVQAFTLSLGAAALTGLALAALSMGTLPLPLVAAGGAQLIALASLDFVSQILNVQRRSTTYGIVQLLKASAALLVGGLIAYETGSAWLLTLGVAAVWAAIAWYYLPVRPAVTRRMLLQREDLRRYARYGLPLTLSVLLMQFVGTADRWLLAYLASDAAVGQYAAGFDLVQFSIGTLGSALSLAFYPPILAAFAQDAADREGRLGDYGTAQLALLLPAAVGLAMIGPQLCSYLIGPDLRAGASTVVPWICGAMLLGVFKAYYTDLAFQLGHRTIGNAIVAAITLVANIGLVLVLIPLTGLVGAGQAAFGAFAIGLIASIVLGRSYGRIVMPFALVPMVKIGASTAFMAAAIAAFSAPGILALTLQMLIGVAAYGLAMFGLDVLGMRRHSIAHLKAWMRRRDGDPI